MNVLGMRDGGWAGRWSAQAGGERKLNYTIRISYIEQTNLSHLFSCRN